MTALRYAIGGLMAGFLVIGMAQAAERNFQIRMDAHNIDEEKLTIEGHTFKDVRAFNVLNKPSDMTVREGDKVTIKVKNNTPVSEGFAIESYDVQETLKPGETKTVSFVADKAGAFTIWCHLHPDNIHLPGALNVLNVKAASM